MTDDATRATSPRGALASQSPPVPARDWGSRDWFHVVVFEWMWSNEGLGLRPGAELMVYAVIYRASTHGGGAYVATNASMGKLLGFPRETISRTVRKLLDSGLIWTVWKVMGNHGGKHVRCYAVSQPVIERAQQRMAARHLLGNLPPQEGFGTMHEEIPACPQANPNVTNHHIGDVESFQHCVTERHIGKPQCDVPSRSQCDESSHVTRRHIGRNDTLPADTMAFDIPLISTYHISTDQSTTDDVENPEDADRPCAVSVPDAPVAVAGHTLTPDDVAAFNELVARSLRPVDAGYVERNLREFARIISEGITADVILTAYDEYADYQRQMMREQGENRPMHLLNWLRQRPNTNIQYVLNRLDDEWARRDEYRGSRKDGKPRPSHEHPRLERCIDHGRHVWYATDERGSRLVDGSRGVDSPTQAKALYRAMYEREQTAPKGRR